MGGIKKSKRWNFGREGTRRIHEHDSLFTTRGQKCQVSNDKIHHIGIT